MDATQQMIGEINWAARNLAYNLDFIPDDKLDWKPAPSAKSALEITAEVVMVFGMMQAAIQNALNSDSSETPENPPVFKSRDEAKTAVVQAAEDYIAFLPTVPAERMEENVSMPFGTMPIGFLLSMPMTDAIHHHGQIAYIQTLLGDTESHFDMSLLPS